MVEKSCDKWFEMPAGCFCGVFIKEETAKKLQKLLWRQTQEIKEFLTENKGDIIPSNWTLAYQNGEQTVVHFSNTKDDVSKRIKLFDKTMRIEYVRGGVFFTDEQFADASNAVREFYMEHYSDD